MLDRRAFLAVAAGTAGAGILSVRPAPGWAAADEDAFAACVRTDDGRFAVAVVSVAGEILQLHPMPDRGHDVAFDRVSGRCVAFARRPGTFAVVFERGGRAPPEVIVAAPGRHFFGHGVFSADGARLYATEHDIAGGEGRIGVYDARDRFRRIDEFPSGGIGPHELVWCADGRTLAIANGGLETDPAFGRRVLNEAGVRSSLTLVDASAGRIVAVAGTGTGLDMLSIRHLALDHAGAVWFGCQFEGDPLEAPPLVGRMGLDGAVEMIALPEEVRHRPRNYIGSVAVTGNGSTVVLSSPRGGLLVGFDTASRAFIGTIELADGCGLAPHGDGLTATAGTGRIVEVACDDDGFAAMPVAGVPVAFDNHLARLA